MSAPSCEFEARCVASLLGSPQLSPKFFGLAINEGQLEIDTMRFLCCEGTAGRYDAKTKTVRRCDLLGRRRNLETLLRQMQSCWPEFEAGNLGRLAGLMDAPTEKRWLKFLHHGRQAWAFRVEPYKGPSWMWAAASLCTWRLGMRCQVISYSSLRPELQPLAGKDHPEILFVEGIQKLSDPKRALQLEEVIAFAYGANIRLVLEFCHRQVVEPEQPKPPGQGFSKVGLLSRRAAILQAKDPLTFLEGNTRSRLESMCLAERIL